MGVEDLIAKVSGRCDSKLIKTTRMENLSSRRKEFLSKLYEENDLNSRLLGTVLNGVYTEQKTTFLMSLPLLRSLIAVDYENGNLNRNSLNDQEFKKFVAVLRKNEIIEVLIESEKKSPKFPNGLASTWQIVDRDALKIVDIELDDFDEAGWPWDFEEQYENTMNAYYQNGLYSSEEPKKIKSEESIPKTSISVVQKPVHVKKKYNFD